jgi:UPF0755 protein
MKLRFLVWVLLVVLVGTLWPANPFDLSKIQVTIPRGATARSVKELLQKNKVLTRPSAFLLLVKLFRMQEDIKAGEYSFSPSDPLTRVLIKLWSGETLPQKEIQATFPEGASIYRMGLILKAEGFAHYRQFQALVHEGISPSLRERHRSLFRYIPSESLEGYLFPDTYRVLKEASAEALAEVMIERFEEKILPFWDRSRGRTRMSLHEIITLASIIEKEAKVPSERPLISSVFYNRMKAGMPLAADPTIKYALERPSKIVYYDQLSVRSPYNTYKRKGLPPGPICNPGIESIKAAVFPAKTNYLFFVARKDGAHVFSKSWEEHQMARSKLTPTQSSPGVLRKYRRPRG